MMGVCSDVLQLVGSGGISYFAFLMNARVALEGFLLLSEVALSVSLARVQCQEHRQNLV